MNRRRFLQTAAAVVPASRLLGAGLAQGTDAAGAPDLTPSTIPRWRGFNIQPGFQSGPRFRELDFELMAEWGFDFARIPMAYWMWVPSEGSRKPPSEKDWMTIREDALKEVDQAVELGKQYGIHVNLNFHRIPGYCVNGRELEPHDLFRGPAEGQQKALDAAVFHWKTFADRYKGIPNRRLSFDLMNEPPFMETEDRYVEVVRALVAGIREKDPNRLIVADGIDIGQTPVHGIVDLGLMQSTRGYLPKAVSHYTATWVPRAEFETMKPPTWPLVDDLGRTWNKETLRQQLIAKWQPLVDKGVKVHVGEWGCFKNTPHDVALAWMTDCLSLWKEAGWGFALWNLQGTFGVLDSERADVRYEDFRGHKLDRKMLELLRAA